MLHSIYIHASKNNNDNIAGGEDEAGPLALRHVKRATLHMRVAPPPGLPRPWSVLNGFRGLFWKQCRLLAEQLRLILVRLAMLHHNFMEYMKLSLDAHVKNEYLAQPTPPPVVISSLFLSVSQLRACHRAWAPTAKKGITAPHSHRCKSPSTTSSLSDPQRSFPTDRAS